MSMDKNIPSTLAHRFLGSMRIEVDHSIQLGATRSGPRRFDVLKGGSFEGPRLRGKILGGGSDNLSQRSDGTYLPDVRLVMETDDGHTVLITYRGMRHASDEVHQRLLKGEHVPYTEFYLRNAPFFETSSEKYDWLNRIMSIGVGRREGPMVIYEVFEII
ncbi:MAG: DUF3237 domain-containing protein [Burkholderiaceae bacterium]|nr:DUF3237 domain-containing protein [Burkholderiaceae bacterium]